MVPRRRADGYCNKKKPKVCASCIARQNPIGSEDRRLGLGEDGGTGSLAHNEEELHDLGGTSYLGFMPASQSKSRARVMLRVLAG